MGCRASRGQIWGSQDSSYLMRLEAERIELAGTTAEYYSLNRGTNVDALYGEPDNDPLYGGSSDMGTDQTHDLSWNFCPDIAAGDDALIIPCSVEYVEFDNRNPMVRPEGKVVEYDAIMSIAALHWTCYIDEGDLVCIQGRTPKEGDVCYVFNEWWDVVKEGKTGNIRGTAVTVGFRLELKKRTQFTPDRKLNL